MRTLQPISDPKGRLRDHAPLVMITSCCKPCLNVSPQVRWNTDLIMKNLMYGGREREEFVDSVEAAVQEFPAWTPCLSENDLNDRWKQLVSAIRSRAVPVFGTPVRTMYHESDEHVHLLRQRGSIKRSFFDISLRVISSVRTQASPKKDLLEFCAWVLLAWRTSEALRRNSNKISAIRTSRKKKAREQLVIELRDAFKARDHALVHRLSRRIAGKHVGPKKRRYDTPTVASPTMQQWGDFFVPTRVRWWLRC